MMNNKPIFSFFVCSDIQLTAKDVVSQQKLAAALQDMAAADPNAEALIINGDLVNNGEQASYDLFREIVKQNPTPEHVLYTIGNHEFFKNDGNDPSLKRFLSFANLENVYYSQTIHGYPFIFLGTESWGPVGSPTKDSAVLSDQQLKWLEGKVEELQHEEKPVFVFLHQPLPHSTYGTDIDYYRNGVIQDKEIRNLLSRLKHACLFAGHTHWDLRFPNMYAKQVTNFISTGAIYNTWGPTEEEEETVIDDDGSTGLHIDVHANRVHIKARDFTNHKWMPEYDFSIHM
ncbi:metallophosphoesterase [Sporosarcina sp. Te-1]|uniref:metallophosphoesterase family protein n=1 Tax=Sporosarcina sp. Te-1 TaxID=2818390 RepID=UPI001A9FAAB5|nr:metallophosphoesterase [Sporosarcina sp. Te-1]QTD39459.1 metallophosphoesterase [Sporosarcina sp. Te-1]